MCPQSILSRLRRRDEAAWSQLVEIYGPTVYSWCRKSGMNPCDAADVLQEVLATSLRCIEQFEYQSGTDSFRRWIYAIYRSRRADLLRRNAVRPTAVGGSGFQQWIEKNLSLSTRPVQLDSDEDEDADIDILERALMVVKRDVKAKTWKAFWATVVEGQRPRDVAALLGMSPAAVCMCRSRVLQRLREQINGLEQF